MSKLYDALQGLAPLDFKVQSNDELEDMAKTIFANADLIAGSVPPPAGGLPFTSSNLSCVEANSATSALDMKASAVRPPRAKPEHEALWGTWEKKVDPHSREGVPEIPVYKILSTYRGKPVNWYGFRTIQEGLGFEKWKSALSHESDRTYQPTLFPFPAVRSVTVEKELFSRVFRKTGIVQVVQVSIRQLTTPTSFSNSCRDALVLRLTSNSRATSGAHAPKARPPRQRVCVSIPLVSFMAENGISYTSKYICAPWIEVIREVPYVQFKLEREIRRLEDEKKKELEIQRERSNLSRASRRASGQRPFSVVSDLSVNRNSNPFQPVETVDGKRGEYQKRNTFSLSLIPSAPRRSLDRSSYPTRSSFSVSVNAMLDKLTNEGSQASSFMEPQLDIESNPVEWIMITRVDQPKTLSRLIGNQNYHGTMVYDAARFLNWACSLKEWDVGKEDEDVPPSEESSICSSISKSGSIGGRQFNEQRLRDPDSGRTQVREMEGSRASLARASTTSPDNLLSRNPSHTFEKESPFSKQSGFGGRGSTPSFGRVTPPGEETTQQRGQPSFRYHDHGPMASPLVSDLGGMMPGIALTTDSAISSEHLTGAALTPAASPVQAGVATKSHSAYNSSHTSFSTAQPTPWDNQFALNRLASKFHQSSPVLLDPPPRFASRNPAAPDMSLNSRLIPSPDFSTDGRINVTNGVSETAPSTPVVRAANSRASYLVDRHGTPSSHMSAASDDTFYTAVQAGTPVGDRIDHMDDEDEHLSRSVSLDTNSTTRAHGYSSGLRDLTPPVSVPDSASEMGSCDADTTPNESGTSLPKMRHLKEDGVIGPGNELPSGGSSVVQPNFLDSVENPPGVPRRSSTYLSPESAYQSSVSPPEYPGQDNQQPSLEIESSFPCPPKSPRAINISPVCQVPEEDAVDGPKTATQLDLISADGPRRQSLNLSTSPSGPPPSQPPPPPIHPVSPLSSRFGANGLSPEQPIFQPSSDRPLSTHNQFQVSPASSQPSGEATQDLAKGTSPDGDTIPPLLAGDIASPAPPIREASTHKAGPTPRLSTKKLTKAAPVSFDRFVTPGVSKRSLSMEPKGENSSGQEPYPATPASGPQTPSSARRDSNPRSEGRGRRNSLASAGTYIFRMMKYRGRSKEVRDSSTKSVNQVVPPEPRPKKFLGRRLDVSASPDDSNLTSQRSQSFHSGPNSALAPNHPDGLPERPHTARIESTNMSEDGSKSHRRWGSWKEEDRAPMTPLSPLTSNLVYPPGPPGPSGTASAIPPSPAIGRHFIDDAAPLSSHPTPTMLAAPPSGRSSAPPPNKSNHSSRSSSMVGFAPGTNPAPPSISDRFSASQTGLSASSSAAAASHAVNSAKRWRTLYELSAKENTMLRAQSEELQRKLTTLTIVLGRTEEGKKMMHEAALLGERILARERSRS